MATVAASAIPMIQGNAQRSRTPSTLQTSGTGRYGMRKLGTERWRSKAGLALWVLLLLCLCARGVSGQAGEASQPAESPPVEPQLQTTSVRDSAPKQFFQTLWSDQKAIWTSPFRMNGGQAVTIALPLVAGTAGLIAADQDAARWLPNTPDQLKWSKRVSQIGAIYTLGGVVSGLMLVGKKKDDPEILNTGRSAARALIERHHCQLLPQVHNGS